MFVNRFIFLLLKIKKLPFPPFGEKAAFVSYLIKGKMVAVLVNDYWIATPSITSVPVVPGTKRPTSPLKLPVTSEYIVPLIIVSPT